METITLADYIQYGFLAFIGLLLIALMVAMLRQVRDTGELKGEVRAINWRMDELTQRLERLETTVAAQGREISEIKGLIISLHERVDLVMRHRHDPDSGQVVLTPEEVAAD
jgi:hypothetical protein